MTVDAHQDYGGAGGDDDCACIHTLRRTSQRATSMVTASGAQSKGKRHANTAKRGRRAERETRATIQGATRRLRTESHTCRTTQERQRTTVFAKAGARRARRRETNEIRRNATNTTSQNIHKKAVAKNAPPLQKKQKRSGPNRCNHLRRKSPRE